MRLLILLMAVPLMAQQTVNFSLTVDNAFVLSIAKHRATVAEGGDPTAAQINAPVASGDMTITVVDAGRLTTFPVQILVDTEIIRVCSKAAAVLTVCGTGQGRGAEGSTAATHSIGAVLQALSGANSLQYLTSQFRKMVRGMVQVYPNPAVQVELDKITAANAAIQTLITNGVQ